MDIRPESCERRRRGRTLYPPRCQATDRTPNDLSTPDDFVSGPRRSATPPPAGSAYLIWSAPRFVHGRVAAAAAVLKVKSRIRGPGGWLVGYDFLLLWVFFRFVRGRRIWSTLSAAKASAVLVVSITAVRSDVGEGKICM